MGGQRRSFSIIGTLVSLAFVVHILLALVIIVYPEASRSAPVLKFYRRFVVLGPFFQESRLMSKSHLLVSQYSNGVWSGLNDYGCENVAHPLDSKYSALQFRAFEVFLTEHMARARRERDRLRILNELESYIRSQSGFDNVDSIAMVGIRRGTPALSDTVFQYKFKR